jgi:hypothetical protein
MWHMDLWSCGHFSHRLVDVWSISVHRGLFCVLQNSNHFVCPGVMFAIWVKVKSEKIKRQQHQKRGYISSANKNKLGCARFAYKNFSLKSEMKRNWIRFACVLLVHLKNSGLFFRFFSLQNFCFTSTLLFSLWSETKGKTFFRFKRNKNRSLLLRIFLFTSQFSLCIKMSPIFSHQ